MKRERPLDDASVFNHEQQLFSMRLQSLEMDWTSFMLQGVLAPETKLKKEIFESWQRSRQFGVDPFQPTPVHVSDMKLAESLRRNKMLCEISELCVNTFLSTLAETNFRVDLLDSELTLLRQFGDKKNIRQANKEGTYPGATRQERFFGTTSGYLAARYKRPFQLVGAEHYKQHVHGWTCSSSPIYGPEGDLLGVLSLSGSFIRLHEHTSGMAVAITKAIEFCYAQEVARKELARANQFIEGIMNVISDGIIATDAYGKIALMNQNAGKIIKENPAELLGESAEAFFRTDSSIIHTLENGKEYKETELIFNTKRHRSFAVGSIVPLESGDEQVGSLAVFKDLRSTRGFVKNVAGL